MGRLPHRPPDCAVLLKTLLFAFCNNVNKGNKSTIIQFDPPIGDVDRGCSLHLHVSNNRLRCVDIFGSHFVKSLIFLSATHTHRSSSLVSGEKNDSFD